MKMMSRVAVCPMVFVLLCYRSRQGGVLKRMKSFHFQAFSRCDQ